MSTTAPGCGQGVYASPESQLSPSQRASLLAAGIVYGEVVASNKPGATPKTQFKSAAEYTAFLKGKLVAGSKSANGPRPIQSSIVTDLQNLCK